MTLTQQKRFTKNDASFVCVHCGKTVPPLGYSSRNHCPFCLRSLHVDINPGDRASDCGGVLIPTAVDLSSKKGLVITFKCEKCGAIRRNVAASDDDRDALLFLTNAYNR